MYFLYIMKNKGLPVGEIFEEEIKDIPTSRFSKTLEEGEMESGKAHQRRLSNLSDRILPLKNESFEGIEPRVLPINITPAAI